MSGRKKRRASPNSSVVTPVSPGKKRRQQGVRPSFHSVGNGLRGIQLSGEIPGFNDYMAEIIDDERGKLYLYGGVVPGDDENNPTCHFYCLSVEAMIWENWTNSLAHKVDPRDPLSELERNQVLPSLYRPGSAFLGWRGNRFAVLFGGFNAEEDQLSSDLVFIDLEQRIWFTVPIHGPGISARTHSCMVAVRDELFVFGGRGEEPEDKGDDDEANVLNTVSIGKYDQNTYGWVWRVRDRPYDADVPCLGYSLKAAVVYSGAKILLAAGRPPRPESAPVTLTASSFVLFDTTHHSFVVQGKTPGHFPRHSGFYHLYGLSTSDGPSEPESALICAWVPYGQEDLVPDFWLYNLPPRERSCCLDMQEKLSSLDHEMQFLAVVGDRILLLGYNEAYSRHSEWNFCVELNISRLHT